MNDDTREHDYLTVSNNDSRAEIGNKVIGTKRVKCSHGSIYICKKDPVYWKKVKKGDERMILRSFFDKPSQEKLPPKAIKEILQWLKDHPDIQIDFDKQRKRDYINLRNGKVEITTGELTASEPEDYFTYFIDAEYLPEGSQDTDEKSVLGEFGKAIFTEENLDYKMELLLQIMGYIFCDRMDAKKAFFFIGPSNCGKSVLIRFISRLLGKENVSTVGIDNLADRFSKAEQNEKKLNARGEIPAGRIKGSVVDIFKGIIGNDEMTVEHKFGNPYTMKPTAKLLFAGNCTPTFMQTDASTALVDRMILLIFNKSLEPEKQDKNIEEKLYADRNNIVTLAIQELRELIKTDFKFIQEEDETTVLKAYSESINTIGTFLQENYVVTGKSTDQLKLRDVYEKYKEFCEDGGEDMDPYPTFRKKLFVDPKLRTGKHRFNNEQNPVASVTGLAPKEQKREEQKAKRKSK